MCDRVQRRICVGRSSADSNNDASRDGDLFFNFGLVGRERVTLGNFYQNKVYRRVRVR